MKKSLFGLAFLGALLLVPFPVAASSIQAALIIDGSSSINDSEWNTLRNEAADAVLTLNTDGSVELTVVRFGFEAFLEISPTVISSGNRAALANQIRSMERPETPLSAFALMALQAAITAGFIDGSDLGDLSGGTIMGGTNFEDAISLATSAVLSSTNPLPDTPLQLFNMLTDGNPTVDNAIVTAVQTVDTGFTGSDVEVSAIAARNAAIGAGIDLLSFEAIGFSAADLDFMLNQLAYAADGMGGVNTPGVLVTSPGFVFPDLPPDSTAQGFVISIAGFDEVTEALSAKFVATAAVPEPGSGLMLGLALAGLVLTRRARR